MKKNTIQDLRNKVIVGNLGKSKKQTPKRGQFLYRDGSNYKFTFFADVPEGLKVGQETSYEKLGYDRTTFHKEIVGYKFDKTSDHNLVDLVRILKEGEVEE